MILLLRAQEKEPREGRPTSAACLRRRLPVRFFRSRRLPDAPVSEATSILLSTLCVDSLALQNRRFVLYGVDERVQQSA